MSSPPQEFICPISMSVMNYPLRNQKTGHHFERETIMEWLYRGNTQCPLTRQPMHPDDLVLDRELQATILKWKMMQAMNDSAASFGSDSSDDEFDAAFDDILEITDRFRTAVISQRQQQQPGSSSFAATPQETTSGNRDPGNRQ